MALACRDGAAFIRYRAMVGIDLQGGPMNQLLQYATARALAKGSESIPNLRHRRRDPKRRLVRDAYAIIGPIVDPSQLQPSGRLRVTCRLSESSTIPRRPAGGASMFAEATTPPIRRCWPSTGF